MAITVWYLRDMTLLQFVSLHCILSNYEISGEIYLRCLFSHNLKITTLVHLLRNKDVVRNAYDKN